jgi:hypothetical protein
MTMISSEFSECDYIRRPANCLTIEKRGQLNVVEDAEALCEHHVGVLRSEADVGGLQLPVATPASTTLWRGLRPCTAFAV